MALLDIPQHVVDFFEDKITAALTAAKAEFQEEIRRVELRAEIRGLDLAESIGALAVNAGKGAIDAKKADLQKHLDALDKE